MRFTQRYLKLLYDAMKIIMFKYDKIYLLEYSQAQNYYCFREIELTYGKLTPKNKYLIFTVKEANEFLKKEIFI